MHAFSTYLQSTLDRTKEYKEDHRSVTMWLWATIVVGVIVPEKQKDLARFIGLTSLIRKTIIAKFKY